MAWLGAIVLVGLLLLAFDAVRERVSNRRALRRAERGLPPVSWSRRRRLVTFAVVLAGVAAVIGVLVLLRGGDDSSSATDRLNAIPKTTPSTTATSSPTTTSPTTTSPTTTTLDPGRPPQQIRVSVVNASGVARAAATKSDALGALGYQMVGLANSAARTGSAVQCKPGFEKEAPVLARNVGGTVGVEPFPNPPPAGSTSADCVVVLGT
jgi:LytR cell envelope-related transcriptional attenuator